MQTLQDNMTSPRRHRLTAPDNTQQELGFRTPRMVGNQTIPFRPLGGSTMTPGYFSPRRS